MNIPKELVEQWCGEAYANNIGIQYIAQRAYDYALSQPVSMEPVIIYHGGCTIDCGEHGHHNMEMLKLIPAGTKLYTHPTPETVSMEPVAYSYDLAAAWASKEVNLYTAAQLAQARQQGADGSNQEKWTRRYQEVLDQNNDLKQRISDLEKSNAQLLEALKRMRQWAEADKVNYTGDHPVALARAAIAAAEVKP